MKKTYYSNLYGLQKGFKIMRITILLCLVSIIQVYAVPSIGQVKLDLKMKNTTIEEVLQKMEESTNFRFFYQSKDLNNKEFISIDYEQKTVIDILDEVLPPMKLNYEVFDNYIAIRSDNDLNAKSGFGQDQKSVTGKVTDSSGIPLPGVTVIVKGTTKGTVTSVEGEYSLSNVAEDAIIQFSFIGMKTREILVEGKSKIDVLMVADAIGIEEVVAVGYGTMKKSDLTGSVSSVNIDDQESRAITQSSQILSGKVSGVTVSQGSGQPGRNNSSIVIRGLGTFSDVGTSPLVLVDGLASSLDNVDSNNIKSISVLKDAASAAIYGTRAANGVILVETIRGQKGKLQVKYNSYVGWQHAREIPENINSWEHAMLVNEAQHNMGLGDMFTDEEINLYRSGSDPDNYPNFNHLDNLLSTGSGFQTNHNFSFSNGEEKSVYLFSLGYLNQEGLVQETNYNRYNFLFNYDTKFSDNLELKINLSGNRSITKEPIRSESQTVGDLIALAAQVPTIYAGKKSDGSYGHWHDFGIDGIIDAENLKKENRANFLGSIDLDWEIFNGFHVNWKAGYDYSHNRNKEYIAEITYDEFLTTSPNYLFDTSAENSLLSLQALVSFEKNINNHYFKGLLGFSQEENHFSYLQAFRDNFPNNSLYELDAGSSSNMKNSGTSSEWALRSFFGRINYSYKNKYLVECSMRYDGTSRFPSNNRWSVFPSLSAGWRVSEEPFIKNNTVWLDNLKVRASWGKLGNQNIGNYPYQNTLTLGKDYTFGGQLYPGAYMQNIANSNIKWESTQIVDIGIDLSVFNNKLDLVVDYFNKYTSDILYNITVSDVLGMIPSEINSGEVVNNGFEFLVNYRFSLGNIKMHVNPNLSVVHNEVKKIANVDFDISKGLFLGQSLNAIYGYVDDGLFIDEADIANYPDQPYTAEPGLIRYKDINGPDGIPDGVVTAEYDRKVIASTFPKYNYGMTLGGDYKKIDFSFQLQGVSGNKSMLSGWYQQMALVNGGTAQRWQYENRWTAENPDRNAKYPKMKLYGIGSDISVPSTYWLLKSNFLRLKNIQLGYSLSPEILKKIKMQKLRVYVNAENLYCFNNYFKGWDPEMYSGSDNGGFYPIVATYTFGVNVTF